MSTEEGTFSVNIGSSAEVASSSAAAAVTIPDATVTTTTTIPTTTTTTTRTTSVVDNDHTRTTKVAATDQATTSIIPKSKQQESDELTKRLQKLALERQKESKGERLKVIQNPNSQTMTHLTSVKSFQELNLPAYLLDAIFAMGFDRPSAIQEEALPRILADPPRNLIGQAQSGSGKVR
jgi:ATP-dependent RNA helicase DDX19/DBP5